MRILVATDGSASSRATADYVARLAGAISLEVDLAIVVDLHTVEYKMISDQYVELIREGAKTTAERILSQEVEHFRRSGVAVTPRILYGEPASALCEASAQGGYGLVVLGRRGHGDLQDLLFGSVSNQMVHRCAKPALIVKKDAPPAKAGPIRVLVAADGSHGADDCLDLLAGLGCPAAFEVTLLNVVNPDKVDLQSLPGELRYEALKGLHAGAEAALERAASRLAGCQTTRRVEEGKPGATICRIAQEGDFEIVFVGRRGLGQLEDLIFGSVSHYVLHHAPCHVVLSP